MKLPWFCFIFLLFPYIGYTQTGGQPPKSATELHPRILFSEADEVLVNQMVVEDSLFRKMHQAIVVESEKLLGEPIPVYRLTGRRLLDVARESRRKIFFLSYAWRMTKDDRYLRRAESELLAISAFPDWNPSHFLDAAELTMAGAIGLDWLYAGLSPESR